jgi:hypothetical protein
LLNNIISAANNVSTSSSSASSSSTSSSSTSNADKGNANDEICNIIIKIIDNTLGAENKKTLCEFLGPNSKLLSNIQTTNSTLLPGDHKNKRDKKKSQKIKGCDQAKAKKQSTILELVKEETQLGKEVYQLLENYYKVDVNAKETGEKGVTKNHILFDVLSKFGEKFLIDCLLHVRDASSRNTYQGMTFLGDNSVEEDQLQDLVPILNFYWEDWKKNKDRSYETCESVKKCIKQWKNLLIKMLKHFEDVSQKFFESFKALLSEKSISLNSEWNAKRFDVVSADLGKCSEQLENLLAEAEAEAEAKAKSKAKHEKISNAQKESDVDAKQQPKLSSSMSSLFSAEAKSNFMQASKDEDSDSLDTGTIIDFLSLSSSIEFDLKAVSESGVGAKSDF